MKKFIADHEDVIENVLIILTIAGYLLPTILLPFLPHTPLGQVILGSLLILGTAAFCLGFVVTDIATEYRREQKYGK